MSLITIAVTKIENKVELFVDIYGHERNDPRLTACRINFKENNRQLFATDTIGSGLLTMSMDQARALNDQLTTILTKEKQENGEETEI